MSIKTSKYCSVAFKCCKSLLLLASIAVGLGIFLFWLLLPYVADFKQPIEEKLSHITQHKVSIATIRGGWHGLRPYLGLENVSILDNKKNKTLFHLQEVDVEVDLIASLLQGQFTHGEVSVVGVMLRLQRTKKGAFSLVLPDELKNDQNTASIEGHGTWLTRIGQQSLRFKNSKLILDDMSSGKQYIFENIDLFMAYDGVSLQLGGEVVLPKALGRHLLLSGRVRGMSSTDLTDISTLAGQFYIKTEEINARAWAPLVPAASEFLPVGTLSTESWLTLQKGRVQRIHGHVAGQGMAAQDKPLGRHQGYLVKTDMHWLRHAQGWDLNLNALSVDDGLYVWPSTAAKVTYRRSDKTSRLSVGSHFFRLQDGVNLLASIENMPFAQKLKARGLRGDLKQLYFSVEKEIVAYKKDSADEKGLEGNESAGVYEVHADFEGLSLEGIDVKQFNKKKVNSKKTIIAFKNLSGHLDATQAGGSLRLQSQAAFLFYSALWKKPLPIEHLSGQWQWQLSPQQWRMAGQGIELAMLGFDINGMFHLTQEKNGAKKISPYLDLALRMKKGDLAQIRHYFPKKIMKEKFSHWLEQALLAGKVTQGKVLFRGRLANYPFKQSQGHFEALFNIEQGASIYAPGWPGMRDLKGTLQVDNSRLEVAMSGRVLDSKLNTVKVMMNNILSKRPRVNIAVLSKGPTKDVLAHLTTTPLVGSVGKYLKNIQVDQGTVGLSFKLDLPIKKKNAVLASSSKPVLGLTIQGQADFADSRLSIPTKSEPIVIDKLAGVLGFTEKALSAKKMTADIMAMPAEITVETRPFMVMGGGETSKTDVAQEILVASTGEFSPLEAERLIKFPVSKWLTGQAKWRSVFKVVTGKKPQASVAIDTDFLGMQSTLPIPLAKGSMQRRFLRMRLALTAAQGSDVASSADSGSNSSSSGLPWSIEYGTDDEHGGILSGVMLLGAPKADLPIKRAAFHLGESTNSPTLPNTDLISIKGYTPFFSWQKWSDFFTELPDGSGAYQAFDLDVQVGRVEMFHRQFLQLAVHANKQPKQWSVTLGSPAIKGLVTVPVDVNRPIVLDLMHLYLHKKQTLNEGKDKEGAIIIPNDMPALTLKVNDFRYNGMQFGRINLVAKKQENRIVFERLASSTENTSITGTGAWRLDAQTGAQTTVMDLKVHTQKINHTLNEWKYAQSIKGGSGDAQAHFEWLGAPHDLSLSTLNGDINLYLKDGRLLDVEPGAGRVFGLLSLQSLTKRLALDFSDIFRKGFSFKNIKGQFYVHEGQAFTDDFHMEGPAARVGVKGRVGLLAQDYAQVITVIPQVSSSLPLASALVGGPAVGAAVFVIQKILEPQIDKIVEFKYAVTGSWDNPKIEKVLKAPKKDKDRKGKKNHD